MEVAVENLVKTFGPLRANDGISLRFGAGQIHGVLGENGAGKSTLMKLLSGFLRRDGGAIRLNGRPAELGTPAAALRAGVGMVHQDPLDVPAFTALENLRCGLGRSVLPSGAAARATLERHAAELGFSVPPDAITAALTVGQRQQLALIQLLVGGAQVLILDEPTTGITAAQAEALFAALRKLADGGKTVLFVSHKLNEVAALCDTVSVLRAGRVVGAQMPVPQPQAELLRMMFGEQGVGGDRETGRQGDKASAETLPVSVAPPLAPPPLAVWSLKGVAARDGNLALRGLALDLRPGTITGLAGLEGSGQQTLLWLLSGRLRPQAGSLLLAGREMAGASAEAFRRAGVEYLPADRMADGLIGPLSLADHMALLAPGAGPLADRRGAIAAAEAAIVDYGIKATPLTPLAALSGGNQQRAMLALLPERCVGLLLEQPTRGLDVASARAVWRRLAERRAQGCAVVFASADLDELLEHSDQVLVFFGGVMSPLLPRAELGYERLAGLIGGVGFESLKTEG